MDNLIWRRIISIIAALAVTVSCGRKPIVNPLEEISDTIRGKYYCVSATVQGNPLDLDKDGVPGTDLKEEFKHKTNAMSAIESPLFIHPVSGFNEEQSINVDIPLQAINYNKITGEYEVEFDSSMMYIYFSYMVDSKGIISTHAQNKDLRLDEADTMIYNVDRNNTKGRQITFFQNGMIEILIDSMYYDFCTGQIVKVPVKFVYERFTYAL